MVLEAAVPDFWNILAYSRLTGDKIAKLHTHFSVTRILQRKELNTDYVSAKFLTVVSYFDLLQFNSSRSSAVMHLWSMKPSSGFKLQSSNFKLAPTSLKFPYILEQGEENLLRHHSSQLAQLQIGSVGSVFVKFLSIFVVVQRFGPWVKKKID